MKKLLLLSIMLFVVVCSFAQHHMTFGGISMNMTINQFQQKLAPKGYTVHPNNKELNFPNTRLFKGVYMGQEVELYVSYIPQSKVVYEVKVCFYHDDNSVVESYLDYIKNVIERKYAGEYIKNWGHERLENGSTHYEISGGTITTWIKDVYYRPTAFIVYLDLMNYSIYRDIIEDDI